MPLTELVIAVYVVYHMRKYTIVRGGKKYKVKAHETFYMDGAKSHYLYNHGNSPAKILWITTPPIF